MRVLLIVTVLFIFQGCCLSLRTMGKEEESVIRKIKTIEEEEKHAVEKGIIPKNDKL